MIRVVILKRIVFCLLPAATLLFVIAALRVLQQDETTQQDSHAKLETTLGHLTVETFLRVVNPHSLAGNGSEMFPCISAEIDDVTFPICTYKIMEDTVVSGTFLRDGYFEGDVVSRVIRRLREDDSIQLVDIGANVGAYTLPASRFTKVLAVEPNFETLKRLASSVVLGNVTGNVTIVHNAVSSRRKTARLAYDRANRGDSFLIEDNSSLCHDGTSASESVQCAQQPVKVIILDDLFPLLTKKRAIIKIDVQGHEKDVFTEKTAAKFFSNVDVLFVYMEWEEFTAPVSANDKKRARYSHIETLLNFFYARRYSVFDTYYRKLSSNWTIWPNNVLLHKE